MKKKSISSQKRIKESEELKNYQTSVYNRKMSEVQPLLSSRMLHNSSINPSYYDTGKKNFTLEKDLKRFSIDKYDSIVKSYKPKDCKVYGIPNSKKSGAHFKLFKWVESGTEKSAYPNNQISKSRFVHADYFETKPYYGERDRSNKLFKHKLKQCKCGAYSDGRCKFIKKSALEKISVDNLTVKKFSTKTSITCFTELNPIMTQDAREPEFLSQVFGIKKPQGIKLYKLCGTITNSPKIVYQLLTKFGLSKKYTGGLYQVLEEKTWMFFASTEEIKKCKPIKWESFEASLKEWTPKEVCCIRANGLLKKYALSLITNKRESSTFKKLANSLLDAILSEKSESLEDLIGLMYEPNSLNISNYLVLKNVFIKNVKIANSNNDCGKIVGSKDELNLLNNVKNLISKNIFNKNVNCKKSHLSDKNKSIHGTESCLDKPLVMSDPGSAFLDNIKNQVSDQNFEIDHIKSLTANVDRKINFERNKILKEIKKLDTKESIQNLHVPGGCKNKFVELTDHKSIFVEDNKNLTRYRCRDLIKDIGKKSDIKPIKLAKKQIKISDSKKKFNKFKLDDVIMKDLNKISFDIKSKKLPILKRKRNQINYDRDNSVSDETENSNKRRPGHGNTRSSN